MYITNNAQAVAHQPPTNAQPAPWAVEKSEMDSCLLQKFFCMTSYGMDIPLAILSQLSQFCSLPASWTLHCKWPWLCTALLSSNYRHCCVISGVFLLEPITWHHTGHAEESNSIPAETETCSQWTFPALWHKDTWGMEKEHISLIGTEQRREDRNLEGNICECSIRQK